MSVLLGARELGLDTQWSFGFVRHGARASTTQGVVYLDIGGSIAPGVLDHHHGTHVGCTADLVLGHPELVYGHLLQHWLLEHELGRIAGGTRWTPRIVTHFDPDWDSIVAAHLVMRLIEDGELPAYGMALASYAHEVDRGGARIDLADPQFMLAPHLGYLMIQNCDEGKHDLLMRRGLQLLRRVLDDIAADRPSGKPWTRDLFAARNPAAIRWSEDVANFGKEAELLRLDAARYERDRACATIVNAVRLPAADGGAAVELRAFVAKHPMEAALGKYFVRAEGFGLTVIPHERSITGGRDGDRWVPGMPEEQFPRVVVAIDPSAKVNDDRGATLRGLGFALERAECELRRASDGVDPRGTVPRWDDGSVDNGDPWYDGRGQGMTIVDSPTIGTILPYAEIVRILTATPFWERPLRAGTVALVWIDPDRTKTTPGADKLVPFQGMTETMAPLFKDSREREGLAPQWLSPMALPSRGCRVTWKRRLFPPGTAPTIRIAVFTAPPEGTLEALIEDAASIANADRARPPAYVFVKVAVQKYESFTAPIESLFSRLDIGALSAKELAEGREVALFNSRALVLQGEPSSIDPDPDLEVFLYEAFVRESLVSFSAKLGAAVSDDKKRMTELDTEDLRLDMLRFQSRYYQLEVSRLTRGRRLFEALSEASRLRDHFAELQHQMERLGELERGVEGRREEKADRMMELVLYVVAVLGVYQTIAAIISLNDDTLDEPWFLAMCVVILVVAVAAYGVVAYKRRKKRKDNRKHDATTTRTH